MAGIVLNGDTLDCHELSRFDKQPNKNRYVEEIKEGREFLAYLRKKFPSARIIWNRGNHEERLDIYLTTKAPELFGLDVLTYPSLLYFDNLGVEYPDEHSYLMMGKLNVLHGHDIMASGGTHPARKMLAKAIDNTLFGHVHKLSEDGATTLTGKTIAAWSTGCLCSTSPKYRPFNDWETGFAMVEVNGGGTFQVHNLRVIDGEVL